VVADVSDQLLVMMLPPGEAGDRQAPLLDESQCAGGSPVAFNH